MFITQCDNVANKGDQAILRSEINILKEIFENVEISASTLWSEELLKRMEPNLHVCRPLIDFRVGRKESPLIFYPFLFFLQFFLSMISIMLAKIHLKPLYRSDVIDQYQHADLIISSGHEPFMEGSLYQKRYSVYYKGANLFMLFWGAYDAFIAKKIFRKPFMTFPQSIGPFKTLLGRCLAKFIFSNLDAILLREDVSLRFLEGLGIRAPIYITADMSFLFENHLKFDRQLQKPIIGVSPCFPLGMYACEAHKQNYVLAISKVLDYLIMKYGLKVAFLPSQIGQSKAAIEMGIPDDLEACQMIFQNMLHKDKAEILNVQTAEEFESLIGQLDLLITTRMHPSILASINYVPFVSIIYEHKQTGLLEKLGLENTGIDINDVSYDTLKNKVEHAWKRRDRIKRQLLSRIPLLQKQIRDAVRGVISNLN